MRAAHRERQLRAAARGQFHRHSETDRSPYGTENMLNLMAVYAKVSAQLVQIEMLSLRSPSTIPRQNAFTVPVTAKQLHQEN